MRKRFGGAAVAVALIAGPLLATVPAHASTTPDSDYNAISSVNPSVDDDTDAGIATMGTNTTLAQGLSFNGEGLGTVSTYTDPDDPTGTITAAGTDGSAPSGFSGNLSVSIPTATTPLHINQPDHTTGQDLTFDQIGFGDGTSGLTDTDVAAQSTSDGAIFYSILKGSDAATSLTYHLTLPTGAVLMPASEDSDGTDTTDPNDPANAGAQDLDYVIELNGAVVGDISAPWAKDANGNSLPTTYTLQGTDLIQTVDTTGATFPVVADPHISFGWAVYVRWSASEVHGVAHKIAVGTPIVAAICGNIPHSNVSLYCTGLASAVLIHVAHVFEQASSANECIEMKFYYSPVFSMKRYHC